MRLPFEEAHQGWTVGTQSVQLQKGVFVVILLKAFKAPLTFKLSKEAWDPAPKSQKVQKTDEY